MATVNYYPAALTGTANRNYYPSSTPASGAAAVINYYPAVTAFTPPSITGGVTLWLRGDLGVTNASGKASAWADQSTNGNDTTQGTAGQQPVINATGINNLPTLTFTRANGTKLLGATNLASAGGPRTVFAVVKATLAGGGTVMSWRLTNNQVLVGLTDGTPGTIQYCIDDSARDQQVSGVPNQNGLSSIIEWRTQGTAALGTVLVNGIEYVVSGVNIAADSGTTGFVIGNRTDFAGFGWTGEIGEIVEANRLVAWSDAKLIRNYMASRYNISVSSYRTRYMPLGDSITLGSGDASTIAAGGYRVGLETDKPNLLGVGSIAGPTTYKHQGVAGRTSADVDSAVTAAYTNNPGELVVLMVGTNDYIPPLTAAQTATNVLSIVNKIHAIDANCKVFVADVLNVTSALTARNALYVQQRAAVRAALASVANTTVFATTTLPDGSFADTEHPNTAGYASFLTDIETALTAAGY